MYNVPTYTKFGLHRVPRTDHRRKSRTPCTVKCISIPTRGTDLSRKRECVRVFNFTNTILRILHQRY